MKKETKKIVITIFMFLVTIIWIIYLYTKYNNIEEIVNPEEQAKIEIDVYNFEQLEKIKSILDWLDKDSYSFENLKEFNEKFNQDIKPIKNCYLLSNKNNLYLDKDDFIFMVNLHSKDYRKKYKSIYYVYPEYKIQRIEDSLCSPHWWECGTDQAFSYYLDIISKPCTN